MRSLRRAQVLRRVWWAQRTDVIVQILEGQQDAQGPVDGVIGDIEARVV
jgi:hypothetical protein